ncbi:phage tail protein [Streptomyces ipomoeae]|uniref:phage tail tube protein n=1 Tax=Streptomyces ipomoeae TaxID=103232 RepID=UPI0029AF0736|nr:phage tail tube protein [Streptomyces ipomoeae]MDX2692960.1 phage tail tube protein [Streptomyces ipomoeae]MDX2840692.1 phage tail tube protein [Streptomyces ipomoeae]
MPTMVLLAEYLSINANVLNAYTRKAELTVEVEEKDVTTYASLGWKEVKGGLKSGELGCEFLQSFAATELDSIMWPLLGQVVPFEVRADQAAVGTSNPKYTGNILINGWSPLTGSVGDEATVSQGFPTSGAVIRATA